MSQQQLLVYYLHNPHFYPVFNNDTVAELKQWVYGRWRIPYVRQQIRFSGHNLEDSVLLRTLSPPVVELLVLIPDGTEEASETFRLLYDVRDGLSSTESKVVKASTNCEVKKQAVGDKQVPYIVTHDVRTIRYPDPHIKTDDSVVIDFGTGKVTDYVKFDAGNICMITGGHNIGRLCRALIRYSEPHIKADDSVVIDFGTGKVTDYVKFDAGNICMITGGHNIGRVGIVGHRERHPGSFDIVHIKDSAGHSFASRLHSITIQIVQQLSVYYLHNPHFYPIVNNDTVAELKQWVFGRWRIPHVRQQIRFSGNSAPVVVFTKGSQLEPKCGFNRNVKLVLDLHHDSDWPTIPQVYVNGKFVGGSDIVVQMHKDVEIDKFFDEEGIPSRFSQKFKQPTEEEGGEEQSQKNNK
ncbi:hypothetical protein niasHS_006537 [Heterodera schachtii]|uniref:Ubiquitin-like domain-containing protein n=1 Tax=Heterodera schachtii TaxID=97005 RepID=A0ABD2JHM9_HETSC